MAKANGFRRGSGCYTCKICGKKTRVVNDPSAANAGSCERCWEMGGDENAVRDGHMTKEEYVEAWGEEPDLA